MALMWIGGIGRSAFATAELLGKTFTIGGLEMEVPPVLTYTLLLYNE